jgi:hypothetical protein
MLVATLALCVLWIIAASIGRAATVRALLGYSRERREGIDSSDGHSSSTAFQSLIGLNFLRVMAALAAIFALIGAAILASFASPHATPRPGLAFVLFLPFAGLICIVWPTLNWILSLACIFAVREGEDVLSALSAAVAFFREHLGAVSAVSTWTGLAHLVAFSVAGTAVSFPLAFIQVVPSRLVIAIVILVTLAYFAVVDWLYIARLAGYICIVEMPEAPAASAPPVPPQTTPTIRLQTTIDRDEPILGDIPNLALET